MNKPSLDTASKLLIRRRPGVSVDCYLLKGYRTPRLASRQSSRNQSSQLRPRRPLEIHGKTDVFFAETRTSALPHAGAGMAQVRTHFINREADRCGTAV